LYRIVYIGERDFTANIDDIAVLHAEDLAVELFGQIVESVLRDTEVTFLAVLRLQLRQVNMNGSALFPVPFQALNVIQ
jgi:hypothetical protein